MVESRVESSRVPKQSIQSSGKSGGCARQDVRHSHLKDLRLCSRKEKSYSQQLCCMKARSDIIR